MKNVVFWPSRPGFWRFNPVHSSCIPIRTACINVNMSSTEFVCGICLVLRINTCFRKHYLDEIWGSRSGVDEEYYLVRYAVVEFLNIIHNVRKLNNCINIPSSQTFRSYSEIWLFCPKDGDSTFLRNVRKHLEDYTMSHPRRQYFFIINHISFWWRCHMFS
jgi:hypothetical protein